MNTSGYFLHFLSVSINIVRNPVHSKIYSRLRFFFQKKIYIFDCNACGIKSTEKKFSYFFSSGFT